MRLFLTALITAGVFAACPVPAHAELPEGHNIEFGSELFWHNYEEAGVMEQEGAFWGLNAAYEYADAFVFRAEGLLAFGEIDYTSSGTGSMDDIDDYIFETRGLFGHDIPATETVVLRPFLGFGYRYLNDDSQGRVTTTGALGYERESNYFYSPIGLAALSTLNAQWKLNVSGEYDLFWKGKQKSYLGNAIPGFNTLENDQDKGHGARASIAFERSAENIDIVLETFVRYWNIDQSELSQVTFGGTAIGLGYEPDNETWEFGGGVRVRF